jgi:hypothetical protein
MTASKSPDRHSFQKETYLKRKEEKGEEPSADYLDYFQSIIDQHNRKWNDPKSRKDNMEYDLVTTDWILEKVRSSEVYAQNLYCALCNNDFIKREMWPMLKEQKWSCSWRYAGGIIADMRQQGDYIDWYCSGIRNNYDGGYVAEAVVTEEIEQDLHRLGWIVVKYNGDE